MYKHIRNIATYCTFILIILQSSISAQNSDEPLYDEFKGIFNKKYLNIGALLQVGGDFQYDRTIGTNGFNISNFRLNVSGEFDKGIGYFLQTSFINSPVILDAKIYYTIVNELTFDVGLFKTPFSREFLLAASNIDFVNRSQVVTSLAANRQIGVQARGLITGTDIKYSVGVFNGNKFSVNANDNNNFMYAGRLSYNPVLNSSGKSNNSLEIAINAAQSNDKNVNIPSINSSFSGKRLLFGGDTRFNWNEWFISGEAIYGNLKKDDGVELKPFGYQGTIGYLFLENFQTLLRWDSYKIDTTLDPTDKIIIGLNYWPSRISEFQFNYIIPTKSAIKNHQILLNAQISF